MVDPFMTLSKRMSISALRHELRSVGMTDATVGRGVQQPLSAQAKPSVSGELMPWQYSSWWPTGSFLQLQASVTLERPAAGSGTPPPVAFTFVVLPAAELGLNPPVQVPVPQSASIEQIAPGVAPPSHAFCGAAEMAW